MAARPIWSGVLSFGLLNIPVSLMSGERRRTDISFRMLDCRDNAPVRYERVNSETGEEVPWNEICKAFEYEKGSFVVLEKGDVEGVAVEGKESVVIEAFVDRDRISPMYFEKPYVLVPGKKADKGYVLLRDTLAETGRVGIARVVLRTREYLCAVMPEGAALVAIIMRYQQEVADLDEFRLPEGTAADYKFSKAELAMARQLIDSMAVEWNPAEYHDEFRERLQAMIDERIRSQGVVTRPVEHATAMPEDAATNVVDFMALLQKSLAGKTRPGASSTSTPSAAVGKTPVPAAKKPARAASKSAAKPASSARRATAAKPAAKAPARSRTSAGAAKPGTEPPGKRTGRAAQRRAG